MQLNPFQLERYFAQHEFTAPYLLCCSDCESMTLYELVSCEPDAFEQMNSVWLGYTQSQGDPQLRYWIAQMYQNVSPDEVIIHSGAQEVLFTLANAMLSSQDHVIVHYPCYQSQVEIPRSIGCNITLWHTSEKNGWKLDLDFLKQSLRPHTRLVIITNPHNPTGYLMSRLEYEELVSLAEKYGFFILSDEVYRFLEYDASDCLPSIVEDTSQGIAVGVLSKSFGLAGLRIGWTVVKNKQIRESILSYKDYTTICSSAPSEFLALIAVRNRTRLINRNLAILKKNVITLTDFFKKYENLFSWIQPKAGPVAFPRLSSRVLSNFKEGTSNAFCNHCRENAGVLLLPGTLYDQQFFSYFRIGFGRKNMNECLQKFEEYIIEKLLNECS